MNNAELIKALRYCVTESDSTDLWCEKCGYYDTDCDKLKLDAANALEAAEQRIKELEAQLPKQGKWISDLPNGLFENVNHWKCSVCGKHCHFREDYCPNCGARMTEEDHE